MADKFLLPEDLVDLALALRQAGYSVGANQCIAANRVLVTLAANGKRFPDLWPLRTWLAPIFCDSPSEQADFDRHFRNWLAARGEFVDLGVAPTPAAAPSPGASPARRTDSRTPRWIAAAVLAVFVLAAASLAYDIYHRSVVRTLHGTVVDANNSALAGAAITVGSRSMTPTTDRNGSFSFTFRLLDLPLTVTARNFGLQTERTIDSSNWKQLPTLRLALPEAAPVALPPKSNDRLALTSAELLALQAALHPGPESQPGSGAGAQPVRPPSYWQTFYRYYYWSILVLAAMFPFLVLGLWMLWVYLPRVGRQNQVRQELSSIYC